MKMSRLTYRQSAFLLSAKAIVIGERTTVNLVKVEFKEELFGVL